MELSPGQDADITGEVRSRRVKPRQGGPDFVKAQLVLAEGDPVTVVWWDAGLAPPEGQRIRVKGRAKEYSGELEVHAEETVVDRSRPPANSMAQVVGFWMECVEAEAAGSLQIWLRSRRHLEFTQGPNPLLVPFQFLRGSDAARWCQQRSMALGEAVLAGWPLVIGIDRDGSSSRPVASPLLSTEIRLSRTDDGWSVEPEGTGIDFNPYALDLLGMDGEQRDEITQLVESSPEVEEAGNTAERAAAILSVVAEAGVDGVAELNLNRLAEHGERSGIHSTGVLLVPAGSPRITRMLRDDLQELINDPEPLMEGPAAVLLGRSRAPKAPFPKPHPTVVDSSLAQDRAVTSAMEKPFTVLTGPPGTGKSQVLANVIAAAVVREESVLFASNNHQAVDVVFERLRQTTTNPCIVRARTARERSKMANEIRAILDRPPDDALPPKESAELQKRVKSVHDVVRHRVDCTRELQRLRDELAALPETDDEEAAAIDRSLQRLRADLDAVRPLQSCDVPVEIDLPTLDAAERAVDTALKRFGERLGVRRRWANHLERLDSARRALDELRMLLGGDSEDYERPLQSVAGRRPRKSLQPWNDFAKLKRRHETAREVIRSRAEAAEKKSSLKEQISHQQAQLDGRIEQLRAALENQIAAQQSTLAVLPTEYSLDDDLHRLAAERNRSGQSLLNQRWQKMSTGPARVAATQLADALFEAASAGGAGRTKGMVVAALPALPVWAVTNLSARTHFSLTSGMFDLVVIDEASQCSAASVLPLLVRAKRALIIGDPHQLTHITSLGVNRERAIGQRWGLGKGTGRTVGRIDEFSYRARSCFSLAASRLDEDPILLDLHFRSHPAIIGFSNESIYGRRLDLCSGERPPRGRSAIEWRRVDGDCLPGRRGLSLANDREAKEVASVVAHELAHIPEITPSLGVVTPYRAQAELIRNCLTDVLGETRAGEVPVATAHRFQGDERDIMIFSPVVGPSISASQIEFAANPNLVNVALTRARRRLVVVGNIDTCLQGDNLLAELARYIARLEAGPFDSPLEEQLHGELLRRGVDAQTGVSVAGHRLDLAIDQSGVRLDIECDGAAFHTDRDRDADRDRTIEAEGWMVVRFSGRELGRNLSGCADRVLESLGSSRD